MPSNSKRKRLPSDLEAAVLDKCRRRCCVCFTVDGDDAEKRGQLAHLDHNPSNDDPGNLVFLCIPHHDQYDSRTSQSKNLTEAEVRLYRDRLHLAVEQGDLLRAPEPTILRLPGRVPDGIIQNVTGIGNVVSGGDIHLNIKSPRSGRRGNRAPIIPGTIGEDARMIGYLRYLTKRYQQFKKWACDQDGVQMRYGLIHKAYEREMGYSMIGTPKELFEKGALLLQRRITDTKLGHMKRGRKLFRLFEEFDERNAQDDSLPL
jgi:hypothetical protein